MIQSPNSSLDRWWTMSMAAISLTLIGCTAATLYRSRVMRLARVDAIMVDRLTNEKNTLLAEMAAAPKKHRAKEKKVDLAGLLSLIAEKIPADVRLRQVRLDKGLVRLTIQTPVRAHADTLLTALRTHPIGERLAITQIDKVEENGSFLIVATARIFSAKAHSRHGQNTPSV